MRFNNESIQSFLFLMFMSLVPKISGDLILTEASATDLVNEIMLGDAQVSGPTLKGHPECNRIFEGGVSTIPGLVPPFPDEGIILSSGNVTHIIDQTGTASTYWENAYPGDLDISEILGQSTKDACVLEFDFVCSETEDVSFSFDYVFGSEEYPEYVNTNYNDGFGFFLNGENIAVVPGTNSAVSINTVNENQNVGYYVDNPFDNSLLNNGPYPKFEADGFTKTMKAIGTAVAGSNRIKLAIADALDGDLDSWVLIKGTSFSCTDESANPSAVPSDQPSKLPSSSPTSNPSTVPSDQPSKLPSSSPTSNPSAVPSDQPSKLPSSNPTSHPSYAPSDKPSNLPSVSFSPVSSKNDVLTCSCTGDPNYKMWNGEYFGFQGNCDQILIDNDYLQLQVRTRPSTSFSLISQVALKLKNPDRIVFQFNRPDNPIINVDSENVGSEIQYGIANEQFFYAQCESVWTSPKPTHTFTFREGGHDQYIKVTETWHGGFGVNVKGHSNLFTGSKGMCGNWNAGGMTKRGEGDDVITVTDLTSINPVQSWQVDHGESILIGPSTYCQDYTEHCNHNSFFPDTTFACYDEGLRRLGNNQESSTVTSMSDLECGDLSCAAIEDPTMRAFCESDVRISGDPRWACQIDYLISDVVTPDPCKFDVEKNSSKFLRGRKGGSTKIRSCGWLKRRKDKFRSRLCTKQVHYFENIATGEVLAPPQIACPDTCASCDKCYENPKTKYTHKANEGDTPAVYKTCKWLAKKSPEQVKDICNRFESIGGYPTPIKACPVTCGLDTCVQEPL